MERKRLFIVVLLLAFAFSGHAQKDDVKVKGAKGEWTISNVTPEQAYEKALIEAKFEALRMAGVEESANLINSLFSSEKGQDYTGISTIELGGDVVDFTVKEKKIEQSTVGGKDVLMAKVTIDAVVRKYTKPRDSSFQIKVEGIELFYKEGEKLQFRFVPSKAGYLKIFCFENDNDGYVLYPNDYETGRLFEAGKQVQFPLLPGFDYQIVKSSPSVTTENNLLVFVYTKRDIPFYEEAVNYHSVLNWIAKISPDERVEFRKLFQITEKRPNKN